MNQNNLNKNSLSISYKNLGDEFVRQETDVDSKILEHLLERLLLVNQISENKLENPKIVNPKRKKLKEIGTSLKMNKIKKKKKKFQWIQRRDESLLVNLLFNVFFLHLLPIIYFLFKYFSLSKRIIKPNAGIL